MAVYSSQVPLGAALADLTLPDLRGDLHSFATLRADAVLVVAFTCNHCPYVKHIEAALGELAREFDGQRVTFAAVCSNDVAAYPDDDVPGLLDQVNRADWPFAYLVDREQSAARAFGAACTPEFFAYDLAGKLGYRGAFDDSTPGNGKPVTGAELRSAISALVSGQPAPERQRPAMGCSIKWLP